MTEEKKGILLNLPQDIFEIMKKFKRLSGVSYTNMLYNSITWWLIKQDLLDVEYIKKNNEKEKGK